VRRDGADQLSQALSFVLVDHHPTSSVIINRTIAARFAWVAGDRLEVLLGTDEQHGLIRLRKNEAGTATVHARNAGKNGGFFGLMLGHIPAFVNRHENSQPCQFEMVEDGWVEIILPA
jgi:hypothetical protein